MELIQRYGDYNGNGNADVMDVVDALSDFASGAKRTYDTFQGIRPFAEELGRKAGSFFKRSRAKKNEGGGGAQPPTNKSDMEALLAALKPKRTSRAKKLSSIAKRIAQKQQYDYNVSKRKKMYEDYKTIASSVPSYEDIYGSGAYRRRARRRRPSMKSRSKGRRVRGRGAYSVGGAAPGINSYSNSLFQVGSSANIPRFSTVSDELGGIVITRKEYVMDIIGSEDFRVQTFFINPGNSLLWSWLAQVAPNFEEYELLGCVFTYNTVTALLSTTSQQVGTVIMACDYNACNEDFINKQEMLQYAGSASIQINNNLEFGIECDPTKNASVAGSQFVTTAVNPSNLKASNPNVNDPKTYYLGQFSIATCNVPTNAQIGELWVSYSVRLKKPKLYEALGRGNDAMVVNLASNIEYTSDTNGVVGWGNYATVAINNFDFINGTPYSEGSLSSDILRIANSNMDPGLFPVSIGANLKNNGDGALAVYYNNFFGSNSPSFCYRFNDNAVGSYFCTWSVYCLKAGLKIPIRCTPYYMTTNGSMILRYGSQGIVNEINSASCTGSATITLLEDAIESGFANGSGNAFNIACQDLKTVNGSETFTCYLVFSIMRIDPDLGPTFGNSTYVDIQ